MVSLERPPRPARLSAHALSRRLLLSLGRSRLAVELASQLGWRLGAKRFVAGETLDECLALLRDKRAEGIHGYVIMLGEGLEGFQRVPATVRAYRELIERLGAEDLGATMAFKLSHVGLACDVSLALRSAKEIVAAASEAAIFARIDMEQSRYVDATLRIYRQLREDGLDNTGVALQAYLHRTADDLAALLELRPNVRIVKGAYLEPSSIAFTQKADVDRNYCRLIDMALAGAGFTAIATHDDQMIGHAEHVIAQPTSGECEFQMLYGIRPQLQTELVDRGHQVRLCLPFGNDWFAYFTRRLAERPANIWFVIRNLMRT